MWFNFRFGLLLQPYIKGDVFHYTAKQQAAVVCSSPPPPPPTHRKISWEQYGVYSILAAAPEGPVVPRGARRWLVIHRAAHPLLCSAFRSALSQTLTIRQWSKLGQIYRWRKHHLEDNLGFKGLCSVASAVCVCVRDSFVFFPLPSSVWSDPDDLSDSELSLEVKVFVFVCRSCDEAALRPGLSCSTRDASPIQWWTHARLSRTSVLEWPSVCVMGRTKARDTERRC